jgi:hypothetical protein
LLRLALDLRGCLCNVLNEEDESADDGDMCFPMQRCWASSLTVLPSNTIKSLAMRHALPPEDAKGKDVYIRGRWHMIPELRQTTATSDELGAACEESVDT